ncbi:MAG TPA: hypothetical protein VD927_17945 [Chryseosolibacter sp.]|nr:hypothetical protein [Chryseosolibacter sp.]
MKTLLGLSLALLFLFSCATPSYCQQNPVLSEKHLEKINSIDNPYRKLKKYQRFFHRDSLKQVRSLNRLLDAKEDSIDNLISRKEKAIERTRSRIKQNTESKIHRTVVYPWAKREAKRHIGWMYEHGFQSSVSFARLLEAYLIHYFIEAAKDDEKLAALKAKMPGLQMPKELNTRIADFNVIHGNPFSELKNVSLPDLSGKFRSLNTLKEGSGRVLSGAKEIKSLSSDLPASAESIATDQLSSLDQVSAFRGELGKVDQLKSQMGNIQQMSDSAYVKEQAKKKAEELAMDYLEQNPEILKAVDKQKMLLMKKFSVVPNSTDLSTATKHTSLKGRSFKERLYLAGNFQLLTLDPVSIDFSPMAGYRFNKKLVAGVGANYRQTFGDSIPQLAPQVLGYKAFASYDVISSFFVYGEFDRNTSGMEHANDISSLKWRNAAFLGAGRKLTLHKHAEMTVIFMYNFLYRHPDPVYPRRWMISLRFQTSELAFLKPNK